MTTVDLTKSAYWRSETSGDRLPPSLAEVTFVGRSNAGKSSLICGLCKNPQLARVSKRPGRTRAINVFEASRGRWLVDLPGYGFAEGPAKERNYWPKMIGEYISLRPTLAAVYLIIDAEAGPSPVDRSMLDWLRANDKQFRVVVNKIDKLGKSREAEHRTLIAQALGVQESELIWVSAKSDEGMHKLRRHVTETLHRGKPPAP